MNITFNDLELSLLFTTLLVCMTLFCSIQFYVWIIFHKRRINYRFYKVRDALIRCVAENIISKDDKLFKMFYSASNDLISVTSTDFFTLSVFFKAVKKFDSIESKIFGKNLISEIKKQPPQFQDAVDKLFYAMGDTFIKKNLLLYLFVESVVAANIMRITVLKVFSRDHRQIITQKRYLEEYRKIENMRHSLVPS